MKTLHGVWKALASGILAYSVATRVQVNSCIYLASATLVVLNVGMDTLSPYEVAGKMCTFCYQAVDTS